MERTIKLLVASFVKRSTYRVTIFFIDSHLSVYRGDFLFAWMELTLIIVKANIFARADQRACWIYAQVSD